MGLFLSTTINRVDKKGRVSVPASFRAALASDPFQGVVLFKSYTQNAIEGIGMNALEELSARMDDNFAFFSDEHEEMATVLFGESIPCSFDGDGRITLPQSLVDFAGIEDHIAFVGLGKKFQLWKPETFEARRESARKSVISKKITLPKGGQS